MADSSLKAVGCGAAGLQRPRVVPAVGLTVLLRAGV